MTASHTYAPSPVLDPVTKPEPLPGGLDLLGRERPLFKEDLAAAGDRIDQAVAEGRFLVLGGAGTIGSAVVRELFTRHPRALHVVDVSENNLAELVRDLRSSLGYTKGDFRTFAVDVGSPEFDALVRAYGPYTHVVNFSALKHVRSERDPFTLMRMLTVNVLNTARCLERAVEAGAERSFCVSTDKASSPVNLMGASKRIMEMVLERYAEQVTVSSARFANVAFSDGSLPFSWRQRMERRQPLVAPRDVRRYFITKEESGILCLFSIVLGEARDVLIPKLREDLHLTTFAEMSVRFLRSRGFEPHPCQSEEEARARADELARARRWPCYFFESDTTGEKPVERFHGSDEKVDWGRFNDIGVVRTEAGGGSGALERFERSVAELRRRGCWEKEDLVALVQETLGEFDHRETFKYLDQKM